MKGILVTDGKPHCILKALQNTQLTCLPPKPMKTASNSFLPLQGYKQKQASKWVIYGLCDLYAAAVLGSQHSSCESKRSFMYRKALLGSLDTNKQDRLPENSSRPEWKKLARAVEA